MTRAIVGTILMACAGRLAVCQSAEPRPKFEAADVHVSAKSTNPFARTGPARNGRYEIKTASMVDLIRIAYGFDSDKILGGPSWLEMDRYDVIGKLPPDTTPETQKLMLQSVLEDRFKLKLHKDTKPLPTYALVTGKKVQLKEAEGTEESGCKPAPGPSGEGSGRLMMNMNGVTTTINMGPGGVVQYMCRNVSMPQFLSALRTFIGANLGPNPIADETGLKGNWNFDIRYSMAMFGPIGMPGGETAERIPIQTAVEKQLGLKLEERQIPTPVIVVDSVNQKPSENPPGTAEALPPIPPPTEFEVASVKAVDPGARMGGRFNMQPGGRFVSEGMPLGFLINRAFNINSNEGIVGIPAFANTDRYDIVAKAPEGSVMGMMDMDVVAPMLLSLLKDRFKLTYHMEDRPVTAYSLVAAKPKMKKADPTSRTSCKNGNAAPGAPPGSRSLTCTNVTMAQFAERLRNMSPDLSWAVQDATGLEGSWDLSLTFSMRMGVAFRGGGPNPPNAVPSASEPTDDISIFEAIEKQLGLKLEKQKRTASVVVIDHMEQKPTEN